MEPSSTGLIAAIIIAVLPLGIVSIGVSAAIGMGMYNVIKEMWKEE